MRIALLFLLAGWSAISQPFIQKKDGSKVAVLEENSVRDDPSGKRIYFLSAESKIEEWIAYKDFDSASFGDRLFKTFTVKKKVLGFFVLAATQDKTLVLSKEKRYKDRGGFEMLYSHYEVGIIDKAGNLVTDIILTDENSKKSVSSRKKVVEVIKQQFPGCKGILDRVSMYESPKSDTQYRTILVFLNAPAFYKCD